MSNADPGRTRPVFQWLAQLFALMGKESKQIIRDPSSYLVAAILPMIFLLLFGYGITLDAGVMDIVILDESNSQSGLVLSSRITMKATASPGCNYRKTLPIPRTSGSIRPGRVPKPGV